MEQETQPLLSDGEESFSPQQEEVTPLKKGDATINMEKEDLKTIDVEKDRLVNMDDESTKKQKKLSFWRLLLLTISFSGNIMCWSVEIAYATPFLLEIGLGKTFVSYNWLIGPLSALFIQPIVGLISDKLFIPFIGRRKPFLAIGCFLCAVCLILFSWSDRIGGLLYHPPPQRVNWLSIVIGITSFCVLDCSINTVHSAIKTLTIDIVPTEQQTTANLFLSFFAGLGNTMGFAIGSIDFVKTLKMKFFQRNIRPVYLLCTIWLIISTSLTFFSTVEKKEILKKKDVLVNEEKEKVEDEKIGSLWECFRLVLPFEIITVYFVRFFIYFSKFFYFVYMSDAVGRQIFHGDPNLTPTLVDKYEAGVRWCSLCFALLSAFNMVNSPIINFVTQYSQFDVNLTYKTVWCFCQSFQFVGLTICYWVTNKWILLAIFWGLSLMETACISFPYSIFNSYVKENKLLKKYKGISAGIFVSSQCFPEIFVSLLGGVLVHFFIDTMKLSPFIIVSTFGGGMAGIALILILFIKVPEKLGPKKRLEEHWTAKMVGKCVNACKKKKESRFTQEVVSF